MKEIYLKEDDIEFFNGNRINRRAIDEKILPVVQEIMPYLTKKRIEDYLKVYCPRCRREMYFQGKDGYILTYGCRSFGCHDKISISTFPIKL